MLISRTLFYIRDASKIGWLDLKKTDKNFKKVDVFKFWISGFGF